MCKVWCIFYVSAYKGGELREYINMNTQKMLDRLTDDWYFIEEGEISESITDEELLEIWDEWYSDEDNHNLYAYDSRSEKRVFSIKDGKLVSDFPTEEEILERMKLVIEELKEWRQRN